jgi:hypothetical protein
MTHKLRATAEIFIPTLHYPDCPAGLVFDGWAPHGTTALVEGVRVHDVTVAVFSTLTAAGLKTSGLAADWLNTTVAKVRITAETALTDAEHDILTAIRNGAAGAGVPELAKRLCEAVTVVTNKVVDFARHSLGQWWLQPLPIFHDAGLFFRWFTVTYAIDGQHQGRLLPTSTVKLSVEGAPGASFLRRADLATLRKFVASSTRSSGVREFLANARALAQKGDHRSAVVEAVSAMEVALHQFAKSDKAGRRWESKFRGRVTISKLSGHVEKLGLSKSVAYLLPLLFSARALPKEAIEQATAAIDARNSVAHHGQRSLSAHTVQKHIAVMHQLCGLLEGFADDTPPSRFWRADPRVFVAVPLPDGWTDRAETTLEEGSLVVKPSRRRRRKP